MLCSIIKWGEARQEPWDPRARVLLIYRHGLDVSKKQIQARTMHTMHNEKLRMFRSPEAIWALSKKSVDARGAVTSCICNKVCNSLNLFLLYQRV